MKRIIFVVSLMLSACARPSLPVNKSLEGGYKIEFIVKTPEGANVYRLSRGRYSRLIVIASGVGSISVTK